MFALNLGTTFAISIHYLKKIQEDKMKIHNERRAYNRWTTNHSREGLNFVSDFPLITGANIYVRVDYDSQDDHQAGICDCGGVRQIGLAKVKWCREIPDDYGSFYNIGLKYKESAV
jgi:hypothetical protein